MDAEGIADDGVVFLRVFADDLAAAAAYLSEAFGKIDDGQVEQPNRRDAVLLCVFSEETVNYLFRFRCVEGLRTQGIPN